MNNIDCYEEAARQLRFGLTLQVLQVLKSAGSGRPDGIRKWGELRAEADYKPKRGNLD